MPQVGAVGGAVVGQHPPGGDAAVGEPSHRSAQYRGRGGRGLVVVDFGVGDAGVVVDDRVHERVTQQWSAGLAAAAAGVSRGPVPVTLSSADVAPAAAVGDVAELLDV